MSEQNLTQDISDNTEYILEVTQEEYGEAMAKGWTDDDIFKPGKHIFRRRTRKISPREAKIKTTVFIDGDILQHFRRRAEQPNAAKFGVQINQELRTAMEQDLAEEDNKLDEVAEKLLSNPNFLQAISEKLKAA